MPLSRRDLPVSMLSFSLARDRPSPYSKGENIDIARDRPCPYVSRCDCLCPTVVRGPVPRMPLMLSFSLARDRPSPYGEAQGFFFRSVRT